MAVYGHPPGFFEDALDSPFPDKTVASLIRRLDRAADPAWLRGDIIGALGAVTGKRFGYDIGAWRQW